MNKIIYYCKENDFDKYDIYNPSFKPFIRLKYTKDNKYKISPYEHDIINYIIEGNTILDLKNTINEIFFDNKNIKLNDIYQTVHIPRNNLNNDRICCGHG